ncbi:MAG: peptide chain release factor N(5)-glutamine methyltransferase [Hydrocarboniphaga effusa]|nr:peptide chain release factor N(5)-glutamine methyltransferase [Hydrocarboniphaga effusa]
MTISGALAEGRRRLAGHSATPELDAEVLLAHLLNGSRSSLIAEGRELLDAQTFQRFDQLLQRRSQGEPVAYLTGEKEFWSLKLKVTKDVLVPRPETELLVEWVLELFDSSFPRKRESSLRIADLGTGSGAIALALAKELSRADIVATDSSGAALAVARRNAVDNGLDRVRFHEGNWFKALDSRFRGNDGTVEFILSNPPYIALGDPHLADLRFEPAAALTAGPDGLAALRKIISGAGKFLKPTGWLLLEHGAEQGAAVRELFKAADFGKIETRRDLAGLERATGGQWQ